MPDEPSKPEDPRADVDPIDLEPADPAPAGDAPEASTLPDAGGYDVHDAAESAPRPKRDLGDETCPNCGAPRGDRDALLCLRCGFDMKTLTVVKTKTGVTTASEETPGERRRLARPGRGDEKVPLAIAVGAGVLLAIGFLAGAPGLLPGVEAVAVEGAEASIPMAARLFGILRCAVLATVLIACGLLGLLLLAHLLDASAGNLRLAAIRLLGIVLAMRLATWIDLPNRGLEWTLETVLQMGIFFGLVLVLFRFTPRETATYGLATLMSFVSIWLLSVAVAWVTVSPGT